MPLVRANCAWAGDAASSAVEPKDLVQITPWFFSSSGSPGFQVLADSLHDMMAKAGDTSSWAGAGGETHVSIYVTELTGGKSGPPDFSSIHGAGAFFTSSHPREVAHCLSFYGQQNQPGWRGRLYFPVCFRPAAPGIGARPTQTQRDFTLTMADKLAAAGGPEWGWVVFSRKRQNFVGVSHAWVDDEWDTQRRRGLSPTTRSQKDLTG